MTEGSPEFAEEVAGYVQGFDKAMELGIAAKSFSLEDGTYREAYDKIYTVYMKVVASREYLREQGSRIEPKVVSDRITGITQGATYAQTALVGTSSLLSTLGYLEAQLSELLTAMHDSYVKYRRTDQKSAFDLIGAASAADTP